ncbi:metal-dependent hydrolase [Deminuibacter soli]|uniref:Metal-dependent hydrolase n=1 Tax=Deminuibacter soli TaxID=2291815 RepID=A0A3E1NHM7_9BACT|nr:metal-dependent hydrolase [Deminuibacter soli]RFM27344.1 metal-dependent hydrolase [Deminuibacter soli]
MKITYYGHSCFSAAISGKHILFDPFISGNELAHAIDINSIEADYIFLSHGHFDHILDAAAIAGRTGAMLVGIFEIYQYFTKQGLEKAHPLNPGGQVSFDFGSAKSFASLHSSSFPDGSYAGIAAGFALQTAAGNFYYSGDAAFTLDMQLVPRWAKLNFAVLPIGDVLTMGTDEAIEAAKLLNVTHVLGVHYDTFPAIKLDKAAAIQAFANAGITLHLPGIGTSIDI